VNVTYCYLLALYRRGDFAEALRVLDKPRGCNADCLKLFLLAEAGQPEAARQAFAAYRGRYQDGWALMDAATVFRLLGDEPAAVKAFQGLQKEEGRFPFLLREPLLRCLKYNAGEFPG